MNGPAAAYSEKRVPISAPTRFGRVLE